MDAVDTKATSRVDHRITLGHNVCAFYEPRHSERLLTLEVFNEIKGDFVATVEAAFARHWVNMKTDGVMVYAVLGLWVNEGPQQGAWVFVPTRDNLKELGVSKVKDLQQINGHTVAIEENFLLESDIAEDGLSAEDQEEIDTI